MAVERTLSIIKPDATERNITGKINAFFEEGGLRIAAQKRIHLTKGQAQKFYEVHKERPFYDELCEYMCSSPVVVQVLEGENAVTRNREIMGATNPAQAEEGTIRKAHGRGCAVQFRPRFGLSRECRHRDPVLFQRNRNRRLTVERYPAITRG